MRTTFTPTPKVDRVVRERARKSGRSISDVVNELLEQAIGGTESGQPVAKVEPWSLAFRPGFDGEKPSELLYDLELQEE